VNRQVKPTESRVLKSPWIYFAATYIWTWGLCAVLIFKDMSDAPLLSGVLLILGMIGPGVTGILFTHLTRTKEETRDYWKRVIDVRRVSLFWLAIVVALPFALQLLAGVLDRVAGGIGLSWGESASAFITSPGTQLLTLLIISLVPLLEEMGWRGYAQDRLQERYNAFGSSLILGVVWSLWHLPGFFIAGTYHAGLGVGTLEFWLFFIGVIGLSVVVSWIYINTRRSILTLVIFHAMLNLSGELIALSEIGETIFTFSWLAAAAGIVFRFGTRTMRAKAERM